MESDYQEWMAFLEAENNAWKEDEPSQTYWNSLTPEERFQQSEEWTAFAEAIEFDACSAGVPDDWLTRGFWKPSDAAKPTSETLSYATTVSGLSHLLPQVPVPSTPTTQPITTPPPTHGLWHPTDIDLWQAEIIANYEASLDNKRRTRSPRCSDVNDAEDYKFADGE